VGKGGSSFRASIGGMQRLCTKTALCNLRGKHIGISPYASQGEKLTKRGMKSPPPYILSKKEYDVTKPSDFATRGGRAAKLASRSP